MIVKKIFIVSQLARGDAVISVKTLANYLLERGDDVTVVCNNYNSDLFIEFRTLIEDWPISRRRFYSLTQFLFLWKINSGMEDCVVIVPSGNLIEKIISLIRFRSLIKKGQVFTALNIFGMRARKQNYLVGHFLDFKTDISIISRNVYGAHFEFYYKFSYLIGRDIFFEDFKKKFQMHMTANNLQFIIFQVSSLHGKKFLPLSFLKFVIRVINELNYKYIIVSDKNCRNSNSEAQRTPQWFIERGVYDDCLLILQDSFLNHYVTEKSFNRFMWICDNNSYDWNPKHVRPISSLFSFFYMLD
jgi:hypothetical protein